jgi:hypothetical protein
MYWKDLRLCACACGFVVLPCFAVAQNAGVKPAPLDVDLGAVTAQEQIVSPMPGSAAYEAPSVAPMDATQPTAVISQQSIENNFSQTSSYSDIVKLSPSVSGTDPDGPGLMESQVLSIRGFQDGQYNVTFDGIPLVETAPGGDPNDFAHHTTSYFMDNDVGSIDVDRGPGRRRPSARSRMIASHAIIREVMGRGRFTASVARARGPSRQRLLFLKRTPSPTETRPDDPDLSRKPA